MSPLEPVLKAIRSVEGGRSDRGVGQSPKRVTRRVIGMTWMPPYLKAWCSVGDSKTFRVTDAPIHVLSFTERGSPRLSSQSEIFELRRRSK